MSFSFATTWPLVNRIAWVKPAPRLLDISSSVSRQVEDPQCSSQTGDLRDRGKILGMSGRNLSRYSSVLAAQDEAHDPFCAELSR
jgi:hypothetical protein